MASKSEKSFGARLRKLQDAVEHIKTWQNYQPPRPEETVASLSTLIASITAQNAAETASQALYTDAVAKRKALFAKGEGSITKMLVPLRGAVVAKFGNQHIVTTQVAAVIASYRKSKLIKLPADPANPNKALKVSVSQKSFGSRTQFFADIIAILTTADDYTASNPALTLAGLHAKLADLTNSSDSVANLISKMTISRGQRTALYSDLAERKRRIKAYCISQYGGTQSSEYLSLKAIGF